LAENQILITGLLITGHLAICPSAPIATCGLSLQECRQVA
jgi:hypothetical protein